MDDKKSRIASRRTRIDARHSTADGAEPEVMFSETKEENKAATKVAESLAALDAKKARSIDHVTAIRVEADRHENARRIEEEERRQDRLWRLQEEAVASGKANAAVEMRWNDLMDHNMPQDLHREIEAQKAACATIIASKDALIAEFQVELKAKDEEYVKALQQQREELEELLKRMTEQFTSLRDSYEIELDHIEDAFLNEREALLAGNKAEIDALFEKRRTMEMKFVEDKLSRESEYQSQVDSMQAQDAEDYNKLKIRLETDIQILQQQLQHMQATYLLNTEKLEYNYRVLNEKDGENRTTQIQQKRKLARLKDAQASIMQRYQDADKKFKARNAELTEEYRRITKQYKDLQQKFRLFESSDQRKFQEVWAMHEETVGAMMKRLLDADRVIHEQLLGWDWEAPSKELLGTYTPAVGGGSTTGAGASSADATGGGGGAGDGDGSGGVAPPGGGGGGGGGGAGSTAASGGAATGSAAGGGGGGGGGAGGGASGDGLSAVIEAKKAEERSERVRVMLGLLASEARFLVSSSVEEQIAKSGVSEAEANVMRVDAILKAIGIENEDGIGELMTYFYEDADDEGDDTAEDAPTSAAEALAITPEGVVAAVRKFVDDRAMKRGSAVDPFSSGSASAVVAVDGDGGAPEKPTAGAGAGSGAGAGAGAGGEATRVVESDRARALREEADYWHRLQDVIPPKTLRVWKALEKGLVSYNGLLQERSDLVDEVGALRRQNMELNNVLSQYLGGRVNDELIIPPTQTIRLDG